MNRSAQEACLSESAAADSARRCPAPAGSKIPPALSGKLTRQGNDLMHRYGLGHWQLMATQGYINFLQKEGIIGKGKEIDCELPEQGTFAYYEALFRKISLREGKFGELAGEAAARMADKLGRYKKDVSSGDLRLTYWGTQEHYSSQVEVEWGFGSLLGERDLMLHMMANYPLHWMASSGSPYLTAEEASKLYAEAMVPYNDDRYLVDYGEGPTGVYFGFQGQAGRVGEALMKNSGSAPAVSAAGDGRCASPTTPPIAEVQPASGAKILERRYRKELHLCRWHALGHKIYTLDRAIWTLAGQTPRFGVFPDYVYDKPAMGGSELPMVIDGQWKYDGGRGRKWIEPRSKTSKPNSISSKATTRTTVFPLEPHLKK